MSEWLLQRDLPVAWLALDERDNDLRRFVRYTVSALQPFWDRGVVKDGNLSAKTGLSEAEGILTELLNDISQGGTPFFFILDDLHVITETTVLQSVLFLLEHLPDRMHLVISTRADPPWPISRLRAHGEVLEIRAADLRFSLDETAAFLNEAIGLPVSEKELIALDRRIEGWIAGLHMAALSLPRGEDRAGFIRAFTGSHRFVMDYLVEEVLTRQSPALQDFLLAVSVLERLTAPLCDTVTGFTGSQEILMELEARNLFLTNIDPERRWFRFHPLFRDLLQVRLHRLRAHEIPGLHRRASTWYEENGLHADAVNHALSGNDLERIVQLTGSVAVGSMDDGEMKVFHDWLVRAPDAVLHAHPWLLIALAWSNFHRGSYASVEATLDLLNGLLFSDAVDNETAKRIRGHMAAIRTYLGELQQDPESVVRQAKDALALLPPEDGALQGFIKIRLANSLLRLGYIEQAHTVYQEAGETARLNGDTQTAIVTMSEAALVRLMQGRLQEAEAQIQAARSYEDRLTQKEGRRSPAMGVLFRHASTIRREMNRLEEAEALAEEAVRACEGWGEQEALLFACLALGRVRFDLGRIPEAEACFNRALQLAERISPVYVDRAMGQILSYRMRQGKTPEVKHWLQGRQLDPDESRGFREHQPAYLEAHSLLAEARPAAALQLTDSLLSVLENAGAGMYVIRTQVLRALVFDRLNRPDRALDELKASLKRAAPEGYVRLFLDEGPAIKGLLLRALAAGIEIDFSGNLIAELDEPAANALTDALSAREWEVLRMLATDLPIPDIAAALFISAGTVRSHVKRIYGKLDVHSRHEAVAKARTLRLIS